MFCQRQRSQDSLKEFCCWDMCLYTWLVLKRRWDFTMSLNLLLKWCNSTTKGLCVYQSPLNQGNFRLRLILAFCVRLTADAVAPLSVLERWQDKAEWVKGKGSDAIDDKQKRGHHQTLRATSFVPASPENVFLLFHFLSLLLSHSASYHTTIIKPSREYFMMDI